MSAPAAPIDVGVSRRRWVPVLHGMSGVKVASGILIALALVAVAAPLIAPTSPNAIDLTNSVAGSSSAHLLGTDQLGRDVFSRLIYGARTSLIGPLVVVVGSTLIALPISLVASYRRGAADAVLSRVWDAMFGFPTLLLAIAVVAVFGPGFWTATLSVTVIYVPLLARVTRSAVLVEREKPYIEACRLQGFASRRVIFGHVLPNISGIIGAQSVLNYGYALLDLAALTFLGFGVQAPTADWGQMLIDGRSSLVQQSYFEVVAACLAIMVTVLCVNTVGYALADRAGSRR